MDGEKEPNSWDLCLLQSHALRTRLYGLDGKYPSAHLSKMKQVAALASPGMVKWEAQGMAGSILGFCSALLAALLSLWDHEVERLMVPAMPNPLACYIHAYLLWLSLFLLPFGRVLSHFSRVWLFATLCTVARQASLSMDSPCNNTRQLPCPPPGDHPDARIEASSLTSPALGVRFFTNRATWEAPGNCHIPL